MQERQIKYSFIHNKIYPQMIIKWKMENNFNVNYITINNETSRIRKNILRIF